MTGTAGHRWAARTAIAGTCLIALGAFWLSFTALVDLAARSGIAERQAWAWPLIVDGIIVVATVSVVALAGKKRAWYPWMLLAITHLTAILTRTPDEPGVSEASPQASAIAVRQVPAPDTGPALTPAAVAPELLSGEQPPELSQAFNANGTTTDAPHAEGSAAGEAPADRREQARALREAGWSNKRIARHLGVHASTVGRWFALAHPTDDTESDTAGDEP